MRGILYHILGYRSASTDFELDYMDNVQVWAGRILAMSGLSDAYWSSSSRAKLCFKHMRISNISR